MEKWKDIPFWLEPTQRDLIEVLDDEKEYETEVEKLRKIIVKIKEVAEAHKKDESIWNPYRQLKQISELAQEVL